MRRTRYPQLLTGLALLTLAGRGCAPAIHAQDAPKETARALVERYVQEGLARNLALAQQTAAERRAEAGVREARGRFLPSVGVDARYSELSGVVNIGDFINPAYAALNQLVGEPRFPTDVSATLPFRQETRLQLVQPLFNDALFGARDIARARRDLAGAQRRATMRLLAAEIQRAWLGHGAATRVVETLEATLPVLEENVRVAERLVAAGQSTPDATHRARADRSDLLQQLAEARRHREAAQRAFNLLLDRAPDAPIVIADDTTLFTIGATVDAARAGPALAEVAARVREELRVAEGAIRVARGEARIAGSAYLPSLTLAASYGVQGDRYRFDRTSDVGLASVVLSWNLLNGGQDRARREQARWSLDEASHRRRATEQAIRTDVANAIDALAAAAAALTAADDRLQSAARAFALVERRYAEGLATHAEFVAARSAHTGAALNQVVTRYGYAMRAVDLERAAALRPLPE
jgi:outer membrane protein TolC